jgi:hypothetical protein
MVGSRHVATTIRPVTHCNGRVRLRLLAIGCAVVVGAGSLLHAGGAVADPPRGLLPTSNPVDITPRVQDGQVQSIVEVGDQVVVGGTFSRVVDATTGASLKRSGLFAFDPTTGAVSKTFRPVLTASPGKSPQVDVVVPSADGREVYVGGVFSEINGSGPARLQALRLSDGSRSSTFRNGAPSSRVYDAALTDDTLYIAGTFTSVDGKTRRGLASLDPETGTVTGKVRVGFKGTAQGYGAPTVRKIDVTPGGNRLVAIGNFRRVGTANRMQIAMLDTSGRKAMVSDWETSAFSGSACGSSWDSYMRDVSMSPDGKFFVVVTTGGWGGAGRMCDTASRWTTQGAGQQLPTWTAFTGGDTSWAVEVTGPVVYVGGHFRWWNNVRTAGGVAGPGAVAREGLAALDSRNGMPLTWDPTRTRGIGVFDFYVADTALWAGSDTPWWGRPREQRDRLAAFPWQGGVSLPPEQLGSVPGDVVQLAPRGADGADVVSRRLLDATTPEGSDLGDSGRSWSLVRGAFMVDDTVYTGWADGTFTKQSFDGQGFGPSEEVDLDGAYTGNRVNGLLTGDLTNTRQQLRSMFYDPRSGRLYFTRSDSTRKGKVKDDGGLFYRAFSPESDVVASSRSTELRQASVKAIDADSIRGAFLSGRWLYYVTDGGVLEKVEFTTSGEFIGRPQRVNDAIDWAAQGLFLSTL